MCHTTYRIYHDTKCVKPSVQYMYVLTFSFQLTKLFYNEYIPFPYVMERKSVFKARHIMHVKAMFLIAKLESTLIILKKSSRLYPTDKYDN